MDVMVDIETMGTSSRAAIVSIGAVAFDRLSNDLLSNLEPDPTSSFSCNVNLQTSLNAGLEVDGKTIYWWLQQSDDARKAITLSDEGKLDLKNVLSSFNKWITNLNYTSELEYIWNLPSTFDLVILQSAYRAVGSRPAWSHTQEMCMRTLLKLHPSIQPSPYRLNKHNALWDAFYQAASVQRCFNI